MVKEELGHDAVILSTRNFQPEHNGRKGNPWVEVVAAIDFEVETVTSATRGKPAAQAAPLVAPAARAFLPPESAAQARPVAPRPAAIRVAQDLPLPSHPRDAVAADGISFSREARRLQQRFSQEDKAARSEIRHDVKKPAPRGPAAEAANGNRPNPEDVVNWRNQILEQLVVEPLTLGSGQGPTIIALVGPTGVGKTTTAAKIAAWFSLNHNYKVAMLSMDCYRIGATDQLRTYARIMRLPCEVALKEQDLTWAIKKHQHKDLLIIDTAGKSPFDPDHIQELRQWFGPHPTIIPYLVLSATAKKEDLHQIMETYRPLEVPGVILTKLDETRAYATLCQQMARAAMPIACLCTGQKVPEDFLPASKEFLKTLFGEGWDSAMNHQTVACRQQGWMQ